VDGAVEDAGQTGTQMLLGGIVCLLLSAVVAWRLSSPLQSRWQAWKHAREFSQNAYFHRWGAACRRNDAKATYNRLLAWLNRQTVSGSTVSLRDFLAAAGSEKLDQRVEELESRLFKINPADKTRTTWSGRERYSELARCRRRLIRTKQARSSLREDLAPLNPG
jgi:hypothetical protein